MKLTPKRKRFCQEYLVDYNAKEAAIRAGYSTKSPNRAAEIGYQLLHKTPVRVEIAERAKKTSDKLEITAERVLAEIARIGFSDMKDFVTWGPNGVTLKDCALLSPEMSKVIAEVSETVTRDGSSVKFKLHDKVNALIQLGRHLALFVDKHEYSGSVVMLNPKQIEKDEE